MTFKKGDRVRQIAFPAKHATVLDTHQDGWVAVQFDGGGGVFGNGVVDVPPEALELAPDEATAAVMERVAEEVEAMVITPQIDAFVARNRSGRGANRAARLGRIFDAAADACAVEDTFLGAVVGAIERQAPRQRLKLADVRRAFAAFYYGGDDGGHSYPYRVMERNMNWYDAHRRAAEFREAADFYRGGN